MTVRSFANTPYPSESRALIGSRGGLRFRLAKSNRTALTTSLDVGEDRFLGIGQLAFENMISILAYEHLRVHACQVTARVRYSHPEGPIYRIVKDLADTDCYPHICNSALVNISTTS
jgi:hypothetical protein